MSNPGRKLSLMGALWWVHTDGCTLMGAYFERISDTSYRPTEHAGGAWNAAEIHFSPLGGLIVHAIDAHRAAQSSSPGERSADDALADGKQLGRISFDI